MVELSLPEAQLFKLLASLFGAQQVIPHMRVKGVCGGRVPAVPNCPREVITTFVSQHRCLFTVLDHEDKPKVVIEFGDFFGDVVDAYVEEHQRLLPQVLRAIGVQHVWISMKEFAEVLDPTCSLDLWTLLHDRLQEGSTGPEVGDT